MTVKVLQHFLNMIIKYKKTQMTKQKTWQKLIAPKQKKLLYANLLDKSPLRLAVNL